MATKKPPKIDIQQVYFDLDALWWDTVNERAGSGREAHDRLFGKDQVHPRLDAVGNMLRDYMKLYPGIIYSIADFAVSSGHEAVAFFAGRVAGYTGVRRRVLSEVPGELEIAKAARNLRATSIAELRLHQADEDFSKTIRSALNGWTENRAWIYRSIFQELHTQAGRRHVASGVPIDFPLLGQVQRGGMPWKVLKALEDAGGVAKRTTIRDLVAPFSSHNAKPDRKYFATLVSPDGDLTRRNLISINGSMLQLTPQGAEAIRD